MIQQRLDNIKMEEDYRYKKMRIKLNKDDLKRLLDGETVEGYKTAIQIEQSN